MARNKGGSIGTSCGLISLGAPNLKATHLSKYEKKGVQNMQRAQERRKTDPEYDAKLKLQQQLAAVNSTTSSYSRARKSKISLPKFSWDNKEGK
jgi:hypothetical protein